jgi:flagellar motor switch protein FliN/FliY
MATASESSATQEVVARPATFTQLGKGDDRASEVSPLSMMLDVSVTLSAEFGKAVLPLGDVLKLSVGSVVPLDRLVSEPVELSVKGVLLARGEVVVVDDRFAVRIKEIVRPSERAAGRRG